MMKKSLFMMLFCVTQLVAWGQETILIDAGDGVTPTTDNFKLAANDSKTDNMQVGDLLRIYYRNDTESHFYCAFGPPTTGYFKFSIDDTQGDNKSTGAWIYKEITLDATTITWIKAEGFAANVDTWAQNVTLQKLTLVHYLPATGVSLNKSSISLGIGNTYNLLKATVTPPEANQTVTWSVVNASPEGCVSVNATTGEISGVSAGTAIVRASVPNTSYYADCNVTVKQGYTLLLTANPTAVTNAIARTVTITPVVKIGDVVQSEGFDLSYSLVDNTDDKVSIDDNIVSIKAGANTGTKTISVSVSDPHDVYAGATTTVNFDINPAPSITATTDYISYTVIKGSAEYEHPSIKITSQVNNGDGTYMNPQPDITYSAEVLEGQPEIVTLTQNPTNETWFRIDPISSGSTKVKITATATVDDAPVSASQIVDVEVTGAPLNFTVDAITVNDDQVLTLDAILAAITEVYTNLNSTKTPVVSGYEVEVYKDAAKVETSIPAQGSGINSFVITIHVNATNPDYADATPQNVTVTVTHLKSFVLDLTVDKTTIKANGHETATITPTSKYNGTDIPVTYTYVSSDPTVATVSDAGVVTAQKQGSVTITVTATPDDGTTYATMQATSSVITVTQSYVTITKETIDGKEFVVVDVPEGGAFGDISDDPTVSASSIANAVAELKAAANVKVTGNISNSDVQELINLIGYHVGGELVPSASNCLVLDMGSARMTEQVTATTYKCSWVNEDIEKSLGNVKELTLPLPAEGFTTLPANTCSIFAGWNNSSINSLETLTIPEGWTETAAYFSCYDGGAQTTLQQLTTLNLPNSLERIGAYSFADLRTKTLYMPKNVQYIGAYAFSPSSKLEDIYFTGDGKDLKYVNVAAFSTQSQLCNNTVADNDKNGQHMPTIDRSRYTNGGVLGCIMHFPKGCDEEYTDVTREYTIIDTSEESGKVYDKGNYTIIPHGTNTDGTTYQWDAAFQTAVNEKVSTSYTVKTLTVDGAFPDDTYGYSFIWPSQSQLESGYAIANAGYLWNTQQMSTKQLDYTDPENPVDKRGLYQFLVAMGNAPTDKDQWVFPKYELKDWYTIAVPFDMSIEQIKNVFGEQTQVCRISKVTRDDNAEKKVLHLEFRHSVMEEAELDAKYKDIHYEDDVDQSGIRHHYPYMIKPGKLVDELKAEFNDGNGHRVLPNYKTIPGILTSETKEAVDNEGNSTGKVYEFSPILMEGKLKKNSYVLTKYNNKHQFVFFRGVKNGSVYEDGGKASANTAYVQLAHGQADSDTYFPNGTAGAKVNFASFFGDFEDMLTDIDEVEIVCGNDRIADNKIYTINGQLVSGKSLAPGLYIKNGKKFIVK